MKKFLLIAIATVIALTGCTEEEIEYAEKIVTATGKAYKNAKPEVRQAYLSYKDGNITHDEFKAVAKKFGQAYLIERVSGAE